VDADLFWTIVAVGFVLGVGALGGLVGFYWLVILPERLLRQQRRR
jgi:hypothetical protein